MIEKNEERNLGTFSGNVRPSVVALLHVASMGVIRDPPLETLLKRTSEKHGCHLVDSFCLTVHVRNVC